MYFVCKKKNKNRCRLINVCWQLSLFSKQVLFFCGVFGFFFGFCKAKTESDDRPKGRYNLASLRLEDGSALPHSSLVSNIWLKLASPVGCFLLPTAPWMGYHANPSHGAFATRLWVIMFSDYQRKHEKVHRTPEGDVPQQTYISFLSSISISSFISSVSKEFTRLLLKATKKAIVMLSHSSSLHFFVIWLYWNQKNRLDARL